METTKNNKNFSQLLKNEIKSLHLLDHPFYKAWMSGELKLATLKKYSEQYYHHVAKFSQYISATHSNCNDINKRKILLENINDEEGTNHTPHPELWLNFAKGLGNDSEDVQSSKQEPAITNVINTFMTHGKKSYHEGLASLYAYEYQVPEVAKTKTEGLKANYDINDESTLEFFKVHEQADIYHREACEKLLDQLNPNEQKEALVAAKTSASALWDFLTSMMDVQNAA